jgi:hypothetical protein
VAEFPGIPATTARISPDHLVLQAELGFEGVASPPEIARREVISFSAQTYLTFQLVDYFGSSFYCSIFLIYKFINSIVLVTSPV